MGGATVSVTGTAGQKALVTLTTTCSNSGADNGCFMSFTGGSVATVADSVAVGTGANHTGNARLAASASYVVTLSAGTNTFTAQYKQVGGNTATFLDSTIIVHVFS